MPRKPTSHSKKRRAPWHNYSTPGTYMLTVVIDGRRPLLGTLVYSPQPHIEFTPLGQHIADVEINKMHDIYPNVQIWDYIIMPDHIHLIVHVDSPFANKKHLGNVVYGFKTGCTRAWWQLTGQTPQMPGGFPPGANQLPLLFERGYHDGILMREGQLSNWKRYLADNPRRLAIKRLHPDYFTVLHDMDICGHKCQIVGNRFLLDIPDKTAWPSRSPLTPRTPNIGLP